MKKGAILIVIGTLVLCICTTVFVIVYKSTEEATVVLVNPSTPEPTVEPTPVEEVEITETIPAYTIQTGNELDTEHPRYDEELLEWQFLQRGDYNFEEQQFLKYRINVETDVEVIQYIVWCLEQHYNGDVPYVYEYDITTDGISWDSETGIAVERLRSESGDLKLTYNMYMDRFKVEPYE